MELKKTITIVVIAILIVAVLFYFGSNFFILGKKVTTLESEIEELKSKIQNLSILDKPQNIYPSANLIITTGLTLRNQPKDDIKSISINKKEIWFFIHWSRLTPNKFYRVDYTIFNLNKENMESLSYSMTPTETTWNTWYKYTFKFLDKEGMWKTQASLDGNKLVEKTFEVKSTTLP